MYFYFFLNLTNLYVFVSDLFNMESMQNFVKENIGIFMSVLDSIWSIVKGNMSVILTIFTELFYIVLMSGTAVLNFVLSMVRANSLRET